MVSNDYARHFTVWRLQSAASGEVIFRADISYAGEMRDAHAYQYPVWEGLAQSKGEAMRKHELSVGAAESGIRRAA